ncbi:MAG TPA: hypothetical protein VIL41_07990 [Coriobacteriia bacterium]
MRSPLRLVLVAVVLAFALTGAAVASAAPVSWAGVDVTLHQDADGPVMLVAGTLPETSTLPADVELSVPASSTLLWVGQILGGDTSLDPELQFTKTTANGVDVYRVTLTKSHTAQIEVRGPAVASADGVTFDVALAWTSAQAVPSVRLTAVLPAGVNIVKAADGATLQPGEGTDVANSYYYKTFDAVKAGAKLDLTFSYSASAAAAGGTSSSGSSNTLMIFLAILLFVAAVVIAAIAVRMRMLARASDDGDEDE